MKTKTKVRSKVRTNVRAGITLSESHSEVMNNPLYQGSGTSGSNPLYS